MADVSLSQVTSVRYTGSAYRAGGCTLVPDLALCGTSVSLLSIFQRDYGGGWLPVLGVGIPEPRLDPENVSINERAVDLLSVCFINP